MSKKRRLELVPPKETIGALVAERPRLCRVNMTTRKVNDTTNVYAGSNPKGKNIKDYQLSLRSLTDYIFPKWEWTCKSYGLNYAGGHYGDDTYGTVKTAYSLASAATATQQMKCAIDDFVLKPEGWCDTIAWEAGSQGWFESMFLPATWRLSSNATLETTHMKTAMSLEGVIDNARNVVASNFRNSDKSMSSSAQDNIIADFPVHYNGGYQKHEFMNNEPFRVYFEAFEVVPRDLDSWIYSETKTNERFFTKNIHSYCSADYIRVKNKASAGTSAAGGAGTYVASLSTETTVTNLNSSGQIICRKEDPGFSIRPWMSDVLKKFKVSPPIKGTIEPGGKFVYKLSTGPFVMLDSTYRRIVQYNQDDNNPSGDSWYSNPQTCHAVPQFTKFLVVRFWSDYGALGTGTANGEFESSNPHQYNAVSYLPGRLMHVVTEHHEARCMTGQNFGNRTFKDFTKLQYDQSATNQAYWQGINDETDATQLIT